MNNKNHPLVSLIFPAKNEKANVKTTLDSAFRIKTEYPFEAIVVDDGSTDGCCNFLHNYVHRDKVKYIRTQGIGLSSAKNLGADQAQGQYFIFCDAHLFFEDFWIDRLLEPIENKYADGTTPGIAPTNIPHLVGYGQTLSKDLTIQWNSHKKGPFPTAVLPGGCFAVSRDVFNDIGGFDRGFMVWGYEDIEISLKMWLFGYKCYVQPQVKVLHQFRSVHPYTVSYDHIYFNLLRMAYSHFSIERIEKTKRLIRHTDPFQIQSKVLASGVEKQRTEYFARRKKSDDWFMSTFGIPF